MKYFSHILACTLIPCFALSLAAKEIAPQEITSLSEFNTALSAAPFAVVKFSIDGSVCPLCRLTTFHDLAQKYSDAVSFILVRIDKGEGQSIANSLKKNGHKAIMGLPTFVFMKNAEETGKRIFGVDGLEQRIEEFATQARAEAQKAEKKIKKEAQKHRQDIADEQHKRAPKEKVVAQQEKKEASKVITVTTKAEFDKLLAGSKPVIVKFFAQWCGHCKRIHPAFEQFAQDNSDAIVFVAVDADASSLAKDHGVEGFPTFISFLNGKKLETVVGADKNKLERHIQELRSPKIAKPAVAETVTTKPQEIKSSHITEITNEADFNKLINDAKPTIVKFYTPTCHICDEINPAFNKFADQYYASVSFAAVDASTVRDLAKKYEIAGVPTFIGLRNGEIKNTTHGSGNEKLENFIKSLAALTKETSVAPTVEKKETKTTVSQEVPVEKLPAHMIIHEVTTQAQLDEYLHDSKPTIVKFYATWCGPCKFLQPKFEELAKLYHNDANFVEVDMDAGQTLATLYSVNAIPHIKFFKKGKTPTSMEGADRDKLEREIKSFLGK